MYEQLIRFIGIQVFVSTINGGRIVGTLCNVEGIALGLLVHGEAVFIAKKNVVNVWALVFQPEPPFLTPVDPSPPAEQGA